MLRQKSIEHNSIESLKIVKFNPFPSVQDSGSNNMESDIFHNQILPWNIFKFKFSINEFYC